MLADIQRLSVAARLARRRRRLAALLAQCADPMSGVASWRHDCADVSAVEHTGREAMKIVAVCASTATALACHSGLMELHPQPRTIDYGQTRSRDTITCDSEARA